MWSQSVLRVACRAVVSAQGKRKLHHAVPRLSLQLQDAAGKPWNVWAGVLVERYPNLYPKPSELEIQWNALVDSLDAESSALSHREVEAEQAARREQAAKARAEAEGQGASGGMDDFSSQFEDDTDVFTAAPRETAADAANDQQSLDRKLDEKLYLVVKGSNGWQLPEEELNEHDNLRSAAERALRSHVAEEDLSAYYISNAPNCCQTEEDDARKLFVLRAVYVKGQVPAGSFKDFKWLSQAELKEVLPEKYVDSLSKFIM